MTKRKREQLQSEHRPKLLKDWEGRRVRMLRKHTTNGGLALPKGIILIVKGHWRGKLSLHLPADSDFQSSETHGLIIKGVDKHAVRLVPEDMNGMEEAGRFLGCVDDDNEIEDFKLKLREQPQGFLREATLSHLNNLFGLDTGDAAAVSASRLLPKLINA